MASFQFHCFGHSYQFRFKIGFFLLCLFFVVLFSLLGDWQLHRYHSKKILLATYQERIKAPAQSLVKLKDSEDLQFQRIATEGFYLNALTMLVQNKFYHGQLGFEVLTPLQIAGQKKLLLVDRGWVKKPTQFGNSFADNIHAHSVSGYIKLLDQNQFILGKNILSPNILPIVMQKIDINELSRITRRSFYPFILRLDVSQPHGFVRDWDIVTVMPQRHMGYAIQWFILVMVVIIGYLFFCCERSDGRKF